MQSRLNTLGFNAGAPDGAAGDQTHQAVRQFQKSIGAPVTGFLNAAQLAVLMGNGPTPAAASGEDPDQLTAGEMALLQRFLNSQGYDAGTADGVSGRKTGSAIAAYLRDRGYDPYDTKLRDAYRMAMSRSDGATTANSGAAFETQANAETSIFGTEGQFESGEERGQRTVEADTGNEQTTGGFNPSEYMSEGSGKERRLEREIARRAIHSLPDLKDSSEVQTRWFGKEHEKSWTGGYESELAKLYWNGNQFDKQDALKKFRQELDTLATGERLKAVFTFEVKLLEQYHEGYGFELAKVPDIRRFSVRNQILGRSIVMLLPDAPVLDHVPITDPTQARRFIEKSSRANRLSVFVTIENVGPRQLGPKGEEDILAGATLDGVSLSANDTELYRWELAAPETAELSNGLDAQQFSKFSGIPILSDHFAAYDGSARSEVGLYNDERYKEAWSTFTSMTNLKIRPSLLNDYDEALKYVDLTLPQSDIIKLSRGEEIFSLSYRPNEFSRRETMERLHKEGYAEKIVSRTPKFPIPVVEVRATALSEYDFDKGHFILQVGDDENEDPSQFLSSFLSRHKLTASSGSIDVEGFVEHGLSRFPTTLSLSAEKANFLLQRLGGHRAYMAIFSQMQPPEARDHEDQDKHQIQYRIEPQRLALFSDPQLRQLIVEFPISEYLKKAPETKPVEPGAVLIGELLSKRLTEQHIFATAAEDYPAAKGYLDAFLRSATEYGEANEFDRQRVLEEITGKVKADAAKASEIWVGGTVELGEYDSGKGVFERRDMTLTFERSGIANFDADISYNVFNAAQIQSVPVPLDIARRVSDLFPDGRRRELEYRARVKVVGAAWDRSREARPTLKVEHQIQDLYVFSRGGADTAPLLLAHMNLDASAGKDTESNPRDNGRERLTGTLPERPVLSQDLILAIATKDRLMSISDRSLAWLLANRWLNDNFVSSSLPVKFFGDGEPAPNAATVATYKQSFLEWGRALPYEVPKKATLLWERSRSASSSEELSHEQCHYMTAYAEPHRIPDSISGEDVSEIFDRQVNGPEKGTARSPVVLKNVFLGFKDNSAKECAEYYTAQEVRELISGDDRDDGNVWWPRVVVALDRLPMPPSSELGNLAEVDIIINGIDLIDNGDDIPHIRVNARFEEVRFAQFEKREGAEQANVELLRTFNAVEMDARETKDEKRQSSLDIVGLKPGQSFAEAEKIVLEHFGEPHKFESSPAQAPATGAFQSATLYWRQDGQELITLFHEPSESERNVLGVSRIFMAPSSEFTDANLVVSLRKKYGQEQHGTQSGYGVREMAWGKNVLNQDGNDFSSECRMDFGRDGSNVWRKDGQVIDSPFTSVLPWEQVRDNELNAWPNLRSTSNDGYSSCGAYLYVRTRADERNRVVQSLLFDIKAYADAFFEGQKVVQKQIEEQVMTGEGNDNIKF